MTHRCFAFNSPPSIIAAYWATSLFLNGVPEDLNLRMTMSTFEHTGEQADFDELYKIRHSLAHVLAQAVLEMRPGSTLGFGPPIRDGFYYDFILSEPITDEDFPDLTRRMKKILKKGQRFDREELSAEDALARI